MEESAVGALVRDGVLLLAITPAVRFAVRLVVRLLILGVLALAAVVWFAGSG